jgi:hypothetical protein
VNRSADVPSDPEINPGGRGRRRTAALLGGAFAGYLVVAVVVWWHVWSGHPTTATTCGCDDPALFMWFLEWPAYALAHGHNLFYSTALFHPGGVNLLSNTSVLAIGIPLAPVTWIFGPVATLNVASTLGPALSALAMFWLVLRWVRWAPAAFVAGLVFGFSPFVVVNLAAAHLMTAVLVLLPLMVACLDELLIRQRRRPVATGGVLAVLVTAQFFLGTEVLAMFVLAAAAGVVVLVAFAALRHRGELAARARFAGRGLAATAVVSLVLLAYPVWFTLDGPAHLSGLVWPSITPGSGGLALPDLVHADFMNRRTIEYLVGYVGPALPQTAFFGLGLIAVLVLGVLIWRRDRRLWFFGALAVISVVASLGVQTYWTPWRVLAHIPLIQNILPTRFVAIISLCAAIMLGIIVDRTHGSLGARAPTGRGDRLVAGGAALAVAAVAVVPMASALADSVPLTTQTVTLPGWFEAVAPRLGRGQVVLTFPPPPVGGAALAWQAVDSLQFSMATGAGPGSVPDRAGKERVGLEFITSAASLFSTLAQPTAANVAAMRVALAGWGVDRVVVPEPGGLMPAYDRTAGTAWALGFFTVSLGRGPRFAHDAWVWSGLPTAGAPLSVSTAAFDRCTLTGHVSGPSLPAVPDCVVAASRPG